MGREVWRPEAATIADRPRWRGWEGGGKVDKAGEVRVGVKGAHRR